MGGMDDLTAIGKGARGGVRSAAAGGKKKKGNHEALLKIPRLIHFKLCPHSLHVG
jgi:hypothetical protein